VTVLGRGIDELDVEGLEVRSAHGGAQSLAESDDSLLGADDAALDHEPVLVDLTVVGEPTDGGDALLSDISLSRSGLVVSLGTNTQDALVDLSSVEISELTSTGDTDTHTGRMPCTDTGNLAKTSVGLAGKTGHTPTGNDTIESLTLGNTADIDGLTFSEDVGDRNLLLEQALGKVDLVSDGATIDLDLGQVGTLLSQLDLAHLGVGKNTHDGGIVLDSLKLRLDLLWLLSALLGVLGERLPLDVVPVLVESALDLIGQVSSPHGGEGTETVGGGDVANNTNSNHGRSLQDGHGLDGVLLVELGSGAIDLTHAVSHTSLF